MDHRTNKKIIGLLSIVFLTISGLVYLLCQGGSLSSTAVLTKDDFDAFSMEKVSEGEEEASGTGKTGASPSLEEKTASSRTEGEPDSGTNRIQVYICGAVYSPGVYSIDEMARLNDLLKLSGGATKDADLTSVNLAKYLEDGEKVYIMTYGESEEQAKTVKEENDGRIDLNTASKESLMSLPGIGEAKADMIISYRETNSGFAAIEDIMEIEGIKEGVFNKIKDRIRV